jgi:DNA-directed RNA polymerase subunit RPC12/RpoP
MWVCKSCGRHNEEKSFSLFAIALLSDGEPCPKCGHRRYAPG